jgi:hypothetical protein
MAERHIWEYLVANVVAFDAADPENHKRPIAAASADWWWHQKEGFHRFVWWMDAWWPIHAFLEDAGLQGWELGGVTPLDFVPPAGLAFPNYFLILKRPR